MITALALTDAGSVDTRSWPALAAPAWGEAVGRAFGGELSIVAATRGRRRWLVPILRGGSLATEGFVCGHLGCGGAFDERNGHPAPPLVQVELITAIARWLALPCLRLVTPSLPEGSAVAERLRPHGQVTMVRTLSGDGLWASYAGSVRTALRKAWRHSQLRSGLLGPTDADAVCSLVHSTQARVGASYRSPDALLHQMLAPQASSWCLAIGAWIRDRLVSAGLYVFNGRHAAYVFNGWSPEHHDSCPNHPQLDTALRTLRMLDVEHVDLGYSHRKELADNKRRWGAEARSFFRIPGAALREWNER